MDGGDRRLMPFCTKRCCESKIRNSQKMPAAGCRMPAAPSAAYSSGQFSFISNTQIVKLFPTIQV
ncbi:hypothetical protein XG44_18740 [Salmonella enterica subsp. enterica serovar Enteritidis]|uniref:Uncharacterized protein n=1 Tax=Salmonella enteritidis TaxID=149539 RepID=A0A6Y3NCF8_SALEN|nr:hypothetical protein [Salmonella enterica subsp. enterica serovar Enteritidis]EED5798966.1 hypothetical protein [Salmonella enterica subsp. enterica serovar Enteritidis]HAB5161929.1 hypothetical protein [Salmonella enterica subsp. enterica serovar Enteritidis]HAB6111925.1 hypothetical protein [Salmonella enterica subsp. enterica serovar Enteritidis]